ncbi:MAG: hypothetical protein K0R57_3353 [Paenibacillaceae bacterium]|jgi:hypothetical protein|nr:hypothetical protein [Paenibacillaceae bacterium]
MEGAGDWRTGERFMGLEYLASGNGRQRNACRVLQELRLFEGLQEYSPLLVGTVPIDIDIPGSDLDVICEVYDFAAFRDRLERLLQEAGICSPSIRTSIVAEVPRMVCCFPYGNWVIEIFGQPLPTVEQNGFRHMLIEDRILQATGSQGRETVRRLKAEGLKTEPAFAQLLKLDGDPYEVLLSLYDWEERELLALCWQ